MYFLRLLQERNVKLHKRMIEFADVMEANAVFGECDVIASVITTDLENLQDFVSDKIRTVPNVLVTST
jgi:hypothetical protein